VEVGGPHSIQATFEKKIAPMQSQKFKPQMNLYRIIKRKRKIVSILTP